MPSHRLTSRHLTLEVLPDLGCHWLALETGVPGETLELLHRPPSMEALHAAPHAFGSYLLAPWSNRVAGARFAHDGRSHRLAPNFPDGTAIHGDVRLRSWQVTHASDTVLTARLDARALPGFNYPYPLVFDHVLRLRGDQLDVRLGIESHAEGAVPVGMGFHPYFRRRLTQADSDVRLTVPAERVYPVRDCLPTGPAHPVAGAYDLRRGDALGDRVLDDCFTALADRWLCLDYPGTGVRVALEPDEDLGHVVVFAPRNGDFVAVEPVSHVNDGFNLLARGEPGTGVVLLPPGERWQAGFRLYVGRDAVHLR